MIGAISSAKRPAACAAQGARVVLGARRIERLQQLSDAITADGGTAVARTLDVTDRADVQAFADHALAQFGRIVGQPFNASGVLLGQIRFDGKLVVLAMAFKHGLGSGFEFVGLTDEIGAGAALGLGGVARQFDAVDGKHLTANQALAVAEVKHLGKEFGHVITQS